MEPWTEFRETIYKHLYTYLDMGVGIDDPHAPNVSFLTSDGVQVNGHRAVLKYCPCLYFKNLFATKRDIYHLDVSSGVLKTILLFIYKGELDETLNAETMSELISATSPSTFDIPLMVESYFQLLMDKLDWYSIYSNAELDPIHLGIFFDHLKAKQPKFYESSEFNKLSFDQVRRMCESPKRPFSAKAEMTLALFQWATFNKAGDLLNQINELVDMWEDPPPIILQNGIRVDVKTEPGSSNSTPASIQAPTSPQSVQDHEETNNSEDIEIPEENISPILPPVRKSRRKSRGRPARTMSESDNSFSRGSRTPESAPEAGSGPGPSTGRRSRNGPSGPAIKKPRKEARGSKNLLNGRVNGRVNGSPVELTFGNAQIVYFGNWGNGKALLSYSLESRETKELAPKPLEGLKHMTLLSARDKIYCIGGIVGIARQNIVRSLPIESLGQPNLKWNSERKLLGGRCLLNAHFYQNSMYLFGGCDGNAISNCIEKYNFEDPKRKVWKSLKNFMAYSRERYGSAWLDNRVILAGGRGLFNEIIDGDTEFLESVEAFNPISGKCELLPSMDQKRADLQLVTLNGKLYAIGGVDESNVMLKSMEIYSPDEREWVEGPSMNHPRAKGKAFVLDGKIYYAGGSCAWEPTMEVYDPEVEVWAMVEADIVEGADLSTAIIIPN